MFAFVTGDAIYINREKYKSIKYTLKNISILLVTLPILYVLGTIYKELMPNTNNL